MIEEHTAGNCSVGKADVGGGERGLQAPQLVKAVTSNAQAVTQVDGEVVRKWLRGGMMSVEMAIPAASVYRYRKFAVSVPGRKVHLVLVALLRR
jgi:hypothetical protein